MPSGLEIRAQIDTEVVKGLLLMNGGGAIALLAFLPHILGKPDFEPLARSILWSLLLFQGGLLAAIIHNRLRRVCSLMYEEAKANSPAHPDPCQIFRWVLPEPCVCMWSIAIMWISVVCFVTAGLVVFYGGMNVIG